MHGVPRPPPLPGDEGRAATGPGRRFPEDRGRGAGDLRPRRGAQVGLLPRHRGIALHEPRGSGGPRGGHPLRNDAEHLRQVDHRRGEPGRPGRDRGVPDAERAHPLARLRRRGGRRPGRGAFGPRKGPRDRAGGDVRGRDRLRAGPAPLPEGAHPVRDPLPRPGGPHDVPRNPHGPRHRRAGHEGDPDRRERHRDELPDERPVRRGVRPLPRLHRGRDEDRAPRAGPHRDEGDPRPPDQLDLHRLRRRGAAGPARPRREARGHPGGAAPGDHAARDLHHLALRRGHERVHLHRGGREERSGRPGAAQAAEGELRRHDRSTSAPIRSTRGPSAARTSPCGPSSTKRCVTGRRGIHDRFHRRRRRIRSHQDRAVPRGRGKERVALPLGRPHPAAEHVRPRRGVDDSPSSSRRGSRGTTSTTSRPPARGKACRARRGTSTR